MPNINCSNSVFEDLAIVGALSIEKESTDLRIESCFFSHCSRSNKRGGAVYYSSEKGNCILYKNCFEWCFTNTYKSVDYGQTVYSNNEYTSFTDESFIFCSPDEKVVRNGGFCNENGEVNAERVNASHAIGHEALGFNFMYTSKVDVKDCTMNNITSERIADAIGLMHSKGASSIHRVIYISCVNPSGGSPNYDSSYSLSITQCVIVKCTNFDTNYYPKTENIHTSNLQIESLTINKQKCLNYHRADNENGESSVRRGIISWLSMELMKKP